MSQFVSYRDPLVSEVRQVRRVRFGWLASLLLGGVLPLGVIGLEAASGMCADTFFDPIPGKLDVLLALAAPIGNLLTLFMLGRPVRARRMLGLVNAVALGSSLYFTILFLPLLPVAVAAVLLAGLGLLPLAPVLCLIVAIRQRVLLRRWTADARPRRVPGLALGLLAAVATVAAGHLPAAFTNYGLTLSVADSADRRAQGIDILRRYGSREQLLLACYVPADQWRNPLDRWLGSAGVTPQQARAAYYRVTGNPFERAAVPAAARRRMSGWDGDWQRDPQQGSDQVGMRVAGLWLAESRIDGTVDPDANLAYVEWVMVFRNDSSRQQREARAQVGLPPGAVVSRATLWIDGEEREAAFGGRAQTRRAYQSVAVEQRRDPLLVTTAGPDRVLVQCFPIQPQGQMKVRIGMTVPLELSSLGQAELNLPWFTERNFSLRADARHSLWFLAPRRMEEAGGALRSEADARHGYRLRGELTEDALAAHPVVHVWRDPEVRVTWTDEPVGSEARRVIQEVVARPGPTTAPSAVVIAVDLSRPMHRHFADLCRMFEQLPQGTPVAVVGAADAVVDLTGGIKPITLNVLMDLRRALDERACPGGADNLPALERALDVAAETGAQTVVWLCGPQPELFQQTEGMLQRLERRRDVKLVTMQMIGGPNRIAEQLDSRITSRPVSAKDTQALAAAVVGRPFTCERRELSADQPAPPPGAVRTSNHLSRLWAVGQVGRLLRSGTGGARDEAVRLAAAYQLVTAATGAVVLETAQQYAANNLQPVAAKTVPVVPEPSAAPVLAACAVCRALAARRRRPARSQSLP